MAHVTKAYVRRIDTLSRGIGNIMSWAVFVIIGILLIEAFSRYTLDHPTPWSVELAAFVFGAYFILAGGFTLLSGDHVRLDVLYHRWPPKKKAIADVATFGMVVVYIIIFIKGGIENALYSIIHQQVSPSTWGPHLGPIKVILVTGAIFLLLQLVAELIKDLYVVLGKDERS